jgi:2-polyprenyl-3-methyl-5-hydroxy-6-metoxy-1,4-benzoquinol methylase
MPILRRRMVPEIMDQPDLAPERHHHALGGLARVNAVSRADRTLPRALAKFQDETKSPSLRILDVATGAGDVPVKLAKAGESRRWSLSGCDISPVAIEHAERRAKAAGASVDFFPHNVLTTPLPTGYDVILASLFLHHLTEDEAVALFCSVKGASPRLLLVHDLDRSVLGLLAAGVVTRLLTTSSVVHIDGPRSVRAAYTPGEAVALAARGGLPGATVRRTWPFRWLLAWRPA